MDLTALKIFNWLLALVGLFYIVSLLLDLIPTGLSVSGRYLAFAAVFIPLGLASIWVNYQIDKLEEHEDRMGLYD